MSLTHWLQTFGIGKRLTITQETEKKKEKSKQIQRRKHTHNKENKQGDGADRPEKKQDSQVNQSLISTNHLFVVIEEK